MDEMMMQQMIIEGIENEDYDDAYQLLQTYSQMYDEDVFYYLALSDIQLGFEEYQEVIELIQKAIQVFGEDPLFYERLGEAYFYNHMHEEALHALDHCDTTQGNPGDLHLLYLYGRIYHAEEKYPQAVNYFEDVLLDADDELCLYYAGDCYAHLGKMDRAIEYFSRLKQNKEILEEICETLSQVGTIEMLDQFLEDLDTVPPYYRDHLRARVFIKHKEYPAAQQILARAAELSQSSTQFYMAGLLAEQGGVQAESFYRKAIRVPIPAQEDPWLTEDIAMRSRLEALNELNYTQGTNQKYLKEFARQVAARPSLYFMILRFIEAKQYYQFGLDLLSQVPLTKTDTKAALAVMEARGSFALKSNHPSQVYDFLKAHPEIESKALTYQRAVSSFQVHDYKQAYHYASRLMPDGAMAMIMAVCLQEQKRFDEAEDIIDNFVAYIDNHPDETIENLEVFCSFLEKQS